MGEYRPVSRHLVHPHPIEFRELCKAAVPATTRVIVLDLDRTLHLARNMGEYMGWEMSGYHFYGPEYLDAHETTRDTSRFLTHWSEPLSSTRYFLRGCRVWAYPGLFYLLWGRMASGSEASKRLRHRLFGAEPYTAIQAIPTIALMHELSGVSVPTTNRLADRLLRRFAADQTFDHHDIAWLRERCPGVRIILSSASPRPTVAAAARRLGITDWESAEIEIHDDRFSAPFQLSPLYLRGQLPERVSPPSRYRVNAGRAKVARLLERYPEIGQPGVEVVGITDTWHGEDHCWADVFTRVIDVNSTSPFPPLVSSNSPLAEIHSAQLLTRSERRTRADGQPDYLDPRRAKYFTQWRGGSLSAGSSVLDAALVGINELARQQQQLAERSEPERAALTARLGPANERLEDAVAEYNEAPRRKRRARIRAINRRERERQRIVRALTRANRSASAVALDIDNRLAQIRADIGASGLLASGDENQRPARFAGPGGLRFVQR